jgi:hypothetical protein
MRNAILQCIENFGPAPRELSWWDRLTYLRVPKPAWLRANPSDKLMTLFKHAGRTFAEGRIVWGHVVQANGLMFRDGDQDCPGELVYSLADPGRVEPQELARVAHQLYELKGTYPREAELAEIAEYLTNELIRVFGLQVPASISPTMRCRISTTFFLRKHLPNRRLCAGLMPTVVFPGEPYVAMPLPERYWPKELIRWWVEAG